MMNLIVIGKSHLGADDDRQDVRYELLVHLIHDRRPLAFLRNDSGGHLAQENDGILERLPVGGQHAAGDVGGEGRAREQKRKQNGKE
jgi:hypothetical protein